MNKVMVATITREDNLKLKEWLACFDQLQWMPRMLENYIASPNNEEPLTNDEIKISGLDNIFTTAIKNGIDWVLFVDVNLKYDIDILNKFMEYKSSVVVDPNYSYNLFLVHREVFSRNLKFNEYKRGTDLNAFLTERLFEKFS